MLRQILSAILAPRYVVYGYTTYLFPAYLDNAVGQADSLHDALSLCIAHKARQDPELEAEDPLAYEILDTWTGESVHVQPAAEDRVEESLLGLLSYEV